LPVEENEWLASNLRNGFILLPPDFSEIYTPEELSLDQNGTVSFSKGCYTGQEIVARMHYRGKAKRRLFFFTGQISQLPEDTSSTAFFLADSDLIQIQESVVILLFLKNIVCGIFSASVDRATNIKYLCKTGGWQSSISVRPAV
jgi:folate-binding protein YgfZ